MQYFYTRGDNYADVERWVREWFSNPDGMEFDLEYVFEGKLEPISEREE